MGGRRATHTLMQQRRHATAQARPWARASPTGLTLSFMRTYLITNVPPCAPCAPSTVRYECVHAAWPPCAPHPFTQDAWSSSLPHACTHRPCGKQVYRAHRTCGQLVEHHHLEARLLASLEEEQRALDVLPRLRTVDRPGRQVCCNLAKAQPMS